ncbi:MAG: L7Ae/L30e/S12e/Gadd45 family ribosomal protein [Lachnospiraceae bacterium]
MDDRQKVLNLIGLATKAGKTASGEFSTEKAVKTGKASLVIVSEEASDNTKKMFSNMCTYYKVPLYMLGKKDELGHAMGKEMRASLAVLDEGFAKAVEKQMKLIGGSEHESK